MKANERSFEFLEHTADVYVAAYGKTLAEAFENAAAALFETMTDVEDVAPKREETVEATGYDKKALLYNWLEALLVKFELEGILFSKFKVQKIQETTEGLKIEAKIYGDTFDPERHKQKVGIKAVTYHLMEIQEAPKRVTLKFILDI